MIPLSQVAILLHADDGVAVLRQPLPKGAVLDTPAGPLTLLDDVGAGHKVALAAHEAGAPVRKYGQVIGFATAPITAGAHVHLHNLAFAAFERGLPPGSGRRALSPVDAPASFLGFRRPDNRVGTRNYVAVVATVNCSASVAKFIARAVTPEMLAAFPNVDGVIPVTHWSGCGLIEGSEGAATLRRTLNGFAGHPNVGGVLWVALGCEDNQLAQLLAESAPGLQVETLTIQETGGTRATVAEGVRRVQALLPKVNATRRTPAPASALTLGLNCGGSDGYSGITANPALGVASDWLVRHGGRVMLAETPEIYGAEQLLVARAAEMSVADRLMERIRWWEVYTRASGGSMNSNPAPGNKAGGITTILEKSLGAIAKAGSSDLVGVLDYAQVPARPGLHFMDTPGYDPVSVTGLVAGGANLVCFTTGRGSVFGCKPTPSIKLATNSALYARMPDDMDLDCGAVADGTRSLDDMGADIFRLMLDVASGRRTASEELGMGDEEMVPWVVGAVM